MTQPIKTLDVKPRFPEELQALRDLSDNMYFVWNYDAEDLFKRIDPDGWNETKKNPVKFLGRISQQELNRLAYDEGFIAHMERIKQEFDRYMNENYDPSIFKKTGQPFQVAYFTAECGLANCLPIYSGGLGILSGDHLKSASDMNLPIIGVSLAYQNGYFRQYLTHDGWQMEEYPVNNFHTMPMKLVRDSEGNIIKSSVDLKGETVFFQAWRVNVGRTKLYLLDTNIPENSEWSRKITAQLYGGDREMRIRQEIVLGIGGVRMLGAIGIKPAVYHMNEGHSAFAVFERIRALREEEGLSFNEAVELVRATNIFTTHTPVAAGNDTFHPDLVSAYFEQFTGAVGISLDVLLGFGRQDPRDKAEDFCMTVLALRLSNYNNGVSRLHASVSRHIWQRVWPKTMEQDLPIAHVTNGIHIPSWISKEMAENYARYLGPRWIEDPDNKMVWEKVNRIPDTELWRAHEKAREHLIAFARNRLKKQLSNRGVSNRDLHIASEVLNSEVLTIGFARRFAPYKRANLILKDIDRLERILTNRKFPVQIIFAGKAHPQDQMGKEIIKQVVQTVNRETLRDHMIFIEDYDMEVARHMVQGVDVWLNTPRRPLEACGTSGMKAVANGAIHFSVLDGWWDEGYNPDVGWAIGNGEVYDDPDFQDYVESQALYDIIEKDIAPLFYEVDSNGIPRKWISMIKASMHELSPKFNTHRMVTEYWDRFYVPSAQRYFQLTYNGNRLLKDLALWREKIMYNWSEVAIRDIRMAELEEILTNDPYHVEADIYLGELSPEDVAVELYYGRLNPENQFVDRSISTMNPVKEMEGRVFRYECDIHFKEVGYFGLNIRITPNHPNPESRHAMGLVVWG